MTHDAAGNLLADGTGLGTHTYQWDAEGRLVSVDGVAGQACQSSWTWCTVYNALGQRVQWPSSSGPQYHWYDPYGGLLGQFGTVNYDNVNLGTRQLVMYCCNETMFSHVNALGSMTYLTVHDGEVNDWKVFYPFGGVLYSRQPMTTFGNDVFASLPFRAPFVIGGVETDLDFTQNRIYTSNVGRWLSPDPLAGDITNPQSLNRYAYVTNNPCSLTDPLGLSPCTLNIQLINQSGVGVGYVAQAQQQINAILGASAWGGIVQVQFQSGAAGSDLSLTLTNESSVMTALRGTAYGAMVLLSPRVYTGNLATTVSAGNYGAAIGSVGLHELLHRFGWNDVAPSTPSNIMMFDELSSLDQSNALNDPNSQLWNLTHAQAAGLSIFCNNRHPQKTTSSGGGGAGGMTGTGAFVSLSFNCEGDEGTVYCYPVLTFNPGAPRPPSNQ